MSAKKNAKLVRLPKPKADPECRLIRTLVWLLEQARGGKVVGYAMVFSVEDAEKLRCIEAADTYTDIDKHHVLGLIRRMEANYMRRAWPDDDA